MTVKIEHRSLVLFQGDSITDAKRLRETVEDLGRGYAFIAAAWFSALYQNLEHGSFFVNHLFCPYPQIVKNGVKI